MDVYGVEYRWDIEYCFENGTTKIGGGWLFVAAALLE